MNVQPTPQTWMDSAHEEEFGPEVRVRAVTSDKVVRNVLLVVCGALFVAPIIWLVEASIDAGASRQIRIPDLTLGHFANATQPDKLWALWNSVLISSIATVAATVPAVLAGYAFSRHHIPMKKALLLLILFLAGVPINILIIPLYQMLATFDALSLVPTGIILGVTALPFELYIIKNAIDAIPLDLEEAARIEGANTTQILLRVVVPLAMPGIVAGAIFGFVNTWGNFLAPLVLISATDQQPSPIRIFAFMAANVTRYGDIAAYSLVYSLPVVVLYLISAKMFKSGFVLGGAVKG